MKQRNRLVYPIGIIVALLFLMSTANLLSQSSHDEFTEKLNQLERRFESLGHRLDVLQND